MKHTRIRRAITPLALACAVLLGSLAAEQGTAQPSESRSETEVFARVGEQVITVNEYRNALANGVRQKFYHARPGEEELARLKREIGERLVDQVLLAREAERRGIAPDRERVEVQVAEYDRRYAANEQWRTARTAVLPRLIGELERRSRLEQLEAQVRSVPLPGVEDARAFYRSNPKLFTEPEQVRVSLILLRVDPAAQAAAWDAALAEGARLHERLRQGAEFAELARLHSADPSAERGGDLGYVHRGMLPESVEKQVIDTLEPGAYTAPVRLLEGVAIVRLEARRAERLRSFDDVSRSAQELLQRQRGEAAWQALVSSLRAATDVRIDESRYAQPRVH